MQRKQREGFYSDVSRHLEVDVNMISKDVHAEELAAADLTGVLLIPVSQQMFVHVTPAGEDLFTQTQATDHFLLPGWMSSYMTCIHISFCTLPQMGQGEGSFLYLVPSSPLASSSSLFMCFGPAQKRFCLFSSANSLKVQQKK